LGFGFFELFGLEPVAGRFFSPALGTDASPADNVWNRPEAIVINEAAARQLGFASASDARRGRRGPRLGRERCRRRRCSDPAGRRWARGFQRGRRAVLRAVRPQADVGRG